MNFDVVKSLFPSNRKRDIDDNDLALVVCSDLSFEDDNGVTLVKRKGQIMRNQLNMNPLTPQEAINLYFDERGWIEQKASKGKAGTLSEYVKEWEALNPGLSALSVEFDKSLSEHLKENPDFDFYS